MSMITLDFESYYAVGLGFKTMTTEEYIRDKEFHEIGVGIKIDDAPAYWVSGSYEVLKKHLTELTDWTDAALLCHNTLFDGAIFAWRFGIIPAFYLDTLSMARALHGVDAGGSLAALAERYKIGEKGDEVVAAFGKRLADFSPEELARYGEYCKNDCELTYKLFHLMAPHFPGDEIKLIDMTLRMYFEPVFHVDDAILVERLEDLKQEKSEMLAALMEELKCDTEEAVRKKLCSNKQFAELLEKHGIKPPMKVSATTGKDTYAFAKTDNGFIALSEHPDTFIQQLCAVRLGTKSTIEESRITRFIEIGKRNKGLLPIPLKYYGAHTGRWSGSDKVNFQNLPSRDKKKKALKNAILPPDGYVVINCDSSQIEARVLAWLAGQDDVVQQFANKEDVYSTFASKVYGRTITKKDEAERFVGKTCISEGTLVLSDSGWKPIEQVTLTDKLWDGEEWVCHQGLLNNGIKKTLSLCGAWLTPDHQVWSGTKWLDAQLVIADKNILSQTLASAVENLPLQAIYGERGEGLQISSLGVIADLSSTPWINITSNILKVPAALRVPKQHLAKNGTGYIRTHFQMMDIEHDFLTAFPLPLHAATIPPAEFFYTMVEEAYQFMKSGARIEPAFYATRRRLKDGITRFSKWIGLTPTEVMNPETSGLCPEVTTSETKEKSLILKTVYDISNCGSRNRFTILTNSGPVIVHNCTLGLGYGTGWRKLQHTLETAQPISVVLPDEECQSIVKLYRDVNDNIIDLWAESDRMLRELSGWNSRSEEFYLGKHEALLVTKEGIQLPNGLMIRYPALWFDTSEAKSGFKYKSRKGMVAIWGGTVVENVVQALARIVVGEQMLAISEKYHVALTVHDAAVIVVPEAEREEAVNFLVETMSKPPTWAPTLPVACEAKWGYSYGEC